MNIKQQFKSINAELVELDRECDYILSLKYLRDQADSNEHDFQSWTEDQGIIHLGHGIYEYKEGEYTLTQLRSIYELDKALSY